MTTSAPSSANRNATARPNRFAAPVTRATRPSRESRFCGVGSVMAQDDTIATKCPPFTCVTARSASQRIQPDRMGGGGGMNLDLLAIAAHPDDVELTCGG